MRWTTPQSFSRLVQALPSEMDEVVRAAGECLEQKGWLLGRGQTTPTEDVTFDVDGAPLPLRVTVLSPSKPTSGPVFLLFEAGQNSDPPTTWSIIPLRTIHGAAQLRSGERSVTLGCCLWLSLEYLDAIRLGLDELVDLLEALLTDPASTQRRLEVWQQRKGANPAVGLLKGVGLLGVSLTGGILAITAVPELVLLAAPLTFAGAGWGAATIGRYVKMLGRRSRCHSVRKRLGGSAVFCDVSPVFKMEPRLVQVTSEYFEVRSLGTLAHSAHTVVAHLRDEPDAELGLTIQSAAAPDYILEDCRIVPYRWGSITLAGSSLVDSLPEPTFVDDEGKVATWCYSQTELQRGDAEALIDEVILTAGRQNTGPYR